MVVVAGGLALLAAAPAPALANTSAVCSDTFPVISITPPFMPFVLAPATGTVSSNGQTGSVTCVGEIDGDRITGAGTVGVSYVYSNGSCVAHMGLGTANWTVPTEAGLKHLTGTLKIRRTVLSVLAEADFPSARADLAGVLIPLEGDCVLTPLSKVRVTLAGVLVGT
jgi:hypothetical protein